MRRWLVPLLLVAGLVLPAIAIGAYQGTIGNDPTINYQQSSPVDTQARFLLLSTPYTGGGGTPRCSYMRVLEYRAVENTSLYEVEYTVGGGQEVTNWSWNDFGGYSRDPGGTVFPGSTITDPNTSTVHTPQAGWRFRLIFGNQFSDAGGACPTDPGAGRVFTRMVGWVGNQYAPTPTPSPTATPAPTQAPPPAGPPPPPTPAPLELLPPANDGPARVQAANGTGGTPAEVTVTRDGKTYRVETGSTFAIGDVIKVGPSTLMTLEYTIGGRVSLTPGAEARVIGERRIELLGGTTEIDVPQRRDHDGDPRMSRRLLVPALLAALAVPAGVTAASAAGDRPSASAAAAKAAPVVGSVTKLGGAKKLQVQVGGKGKLKAIKAGGKLRFGDRLTAGKGTSATLTLTRPKSVAPGTSLVYVSSAKGSSHRSKLTRKGRTTTVVITSGKTN